MHAPQRITLNNSIGRIRHGASAALRLALLCIACAPLVCAQSQALNGQIEGTTTDANGATVPNVAITATNIETGAERKVTSDENGIYRIPLLPLGTYRLVAETPNFKRFEQSGITLTTGQSATVEVKLEAGQISEVVIIDSDVPIVDPGRTDLGRVMTTNEVRNLPLVSRNPYNFSLLQANVTGRPNSEFGVPRINANGYARRTNYLLDGNNNTQADRAGIRLMPLSEIFVSEVQLVTNGFAAEFGNTPGLIMNAVTPTGTNSYHGSASYRFRRTPFSSRTFFLPLTSPKAGTKVDDFAGSIGGPIIRDRWHFYTGYERVARDLAGEPQRVITISPANQQALIAAGVPASAFPGTIPAAQKVPFFIVSTDAQFDEANRLTVRYNRFRNLSPDNIAGGITTLQRSIDFVDASDSVGVQLISTFSPTWLNEFRYQYARRNSQNLPNANSGTRPSIVVSGIANFGAPEDANTLLPLERSNQAIDNVTLTRGGHTIKFGAGANFIHDERVSGVFARYTFANIAAYAAARSSAIPLGYTEFRETIGNPGRKYNSAFYQFFVQDDWKATRRLKVNYGLRYDLYDVPTADRSAPLAISRDFKVDKNNVAPRLGVVYELRDGDRPTVVRGSAGLYYEPPLLDIYLRALQNNGNPAFLTFIIGPTAANAPRFPNTLGSLPPGTTLPPASVEAVAPDYENLYAIHSNVQVEQALTHNLAVTVGYIHSRGLHIPVYRNINLINPIRTLADGRPVFNRTVISAATRLFPQFNNISVVESVGSSNYDAGTLTLTKRLSAGYQFSANYTYSHAIDDAPEQNLVAVTATTTAVALSDPTNRRRDRGNSLADQRHTFILSFVGRPTFNFENKAIERLVNDNQVGFIVTANSGEVFNITSNQELNNDGVTTGSDRPLFIGRNTGRAPAQYNVDMRYSRFVRFSERYNAEVFGEFVNLFNHRSIFQVNGVVPTDVNGVLTAPLPDFRTRNPVALDSRQFQLGFKFNF